MKYPKECLVCSYTSDLGKNLTIELVDESKGGMSGWYLIRIPEHEHDYFFGMYWVKADRLRPLTYSAKEFLNG
jgi:hypothetical protein